MFWFDLVFQSLWGYWNHIFEIFQVQVFFFIFLFCCCCCFLVVLLVCLVLFGVLVLFWFVRFVISNLWNISFFCFVYCLVLFSVLFLFCFTKFVRFVTSFFFKCFVYFFCILLLLLFVFTKQKHQRCWCLGHSLSSHIDVHEQTCLCHLSQNLSQFIYQSDSLLQS